MLRSAPVDTEPSVTGQTPLSARDQGQGWNSKFQLRIRLLHHTTVAYFYTSGFIKLPISHSQKLLVIVMKIGHLMVTKKTIQSNKTSSSVGFSDSEFTLKLHIRKLLLWTSH